MKTSEKIDLFSKAYVAAQADLKNAVFDKINPHFKSKYATLAGLRDNVVPNLAKHGLAVIQGTIETGNGFAVTTRLVHDSGQWMESSYPLSIGTAQQMGSSYTYARRYSLASICGIASEEDDDANAASEKSTPLALQAVNGTVGASKAGNRTEYTRLVQQIRDATGVSNLKNWYQSNVKALDDLPPDWVDDLRIEYKDKQAELEQKAAA